MKVLIVNKFHYLKGGSEKYYFDLAKLLMDKGHEVAFFSMQNEKNIKTKCKEYFVKESDMNSKNNFKAIDVIYSKANKKKMEKALDDFRPDIVHLNNFQRQLSASIIKPIKKRKIPIVFTAHDLQAICPSMGMLDKEKELCEKCIGGKYINCIKKKCIKNSELKSILGAIEAKYYRNKHIYSEKINLIIAPSEYVKSKFIEDGLKESKVVVLHNFIETEKYKLEVENDGYAFYYGRLSREKGIYNLLEAFKSIKEKKLYIAGEGPEKENIEKYLIKNNLKDRVKLTGYLDTNKINEYVRKSSFVVIPSICRENCPYSVLERFAIGKPVIGSKLGGIPELVINEKNGYTYRNKQELENKMRLLFNNPELAKRLGNNAKKDAIEKFSKEVYYEELMEIYKGVIENGK